MERLFAVRKILRGKLKFLVQQVLDERDVGMEHLGKPGEDNGPIGTILKIAAIAHSAPAIFF